MCLKCLRKMNSEDGQVYSVCILQFSCFTKYNRMQSKHKQTKCEHSIRNSWIRHWIPMFIGTPCTWAFLQAENSLLHWLNCFKIRWLSSNALQPSKPFLKKKALKFYNSFSILSEIKLNIILLFTAWPFGFKLHLIFNRVEFKKPV